MKWKLSVCFLIHAFLFFPANAAQAGPGIKLGLGLHSASFNEDLEPGKLVSIMPGTGAALNLALSFSPLLNLDLRAGRTFQDETVSTTRVNCDWLEAGPLVYLVKDGKYRPFLSAGVGSYKLVTTGLDFEGTGAFLSAGVEEIVNEHHSAKLYFQDTRWKDEDFDLKIEAFNVGLIYDYTF